MKAPIIIELNGHDITLIKPPKGCENPFEIWDYDVENYNGETFIDYKGDEYRLVNYMVKIIPPEKNLSEI